MQVTLQGGARTGRITAPPSKSWIQRYLLLGMLGETPLTLEYRGQLPEDVWQLIRCLERLGAEIESAEGQLRLTPSEKPLRQEELLLLPIGENGTGFRLLLPLAGVFDLKLAFLREGSLIGRPIGELTRALTERGMRFREAGAYVSAEGRLTAGEFVLPGSVSSQYVSSLLLTLPLLDGESRLLVRDPIGSRGYVDMTLAALAEAGLRVTEEKRGEDRLFLIPGGRVPRLPEELTVPGDWSGAAAFLAMGALSPAGIRVAGLEEDPCQPDSCFPELLRQMGASVSRTPEGELAVRGEGRLTGTLLDADASPDLVPVFGVLSAFAEGTARIRGGERLRFKESSRLSTLAALLQAIGCEAAVEGGSMDIPGGCPLHGAEAGSAGDHRLAMAAGGATAGLAPDQQIRLSGAMDVTKSFPEFWRCFRELERTER